MTNAIYNDASLLQKASAVKFGWLAMDTDRRWFWYSKKPRWYNKNGWWAENGSLENVRFLKLPKRKSSFAPLSLIKCTPDGPILVTTGSQFHKIWGMISASTVKNIRILRKGR